MNTPTENYALFAVVSEAGAITSIGDAGAKILVTVAAPRPGSLIERDLTDPVYFSMDNVKEAATHFFDLMKSGLTGVFDTAEARLFQETPIDFCNAMTEQVWDMIDEELEEDDAEERMDDFDNHPMAVFREAMVDACPEYSGEDPEPDL